MSEGETNSGGSSFPVATNEKQRRDLPQLRIVAVHRGSAEHMNSDEADAGNRDGLGLLPILAIGSSCRTYSPVASLPRTPAQEPDVPAKPYCPLPLVKLRVPVKALGARHLTAIYRNRAHTSFATIRPRRVSRSPSPVRSKRLRPSSSAIVGPYRSSSPTP